MKWQFNPNSILSVAPPSPSFRFFAGIRQAFDAGRCPAHDGPEAFSWLKPPELKSSQTRMELLIIEAGWLNMAG